ncbi:acetyltransferase [Herbaspirillum autotrophicum]|uniref:acetyltransferase n=1 Tax=Herbaspirillum autotrophicum TaxID=180195 RepID=UPI00067AE8B5|nr:acetyltransferase [Herbaspirillum autotrophicum]
MHQPVEFRIRPSMPADTAALVAIWHAAVCATHDFLAPQDVEDIAVMVAEDYLPHTEVWVVLDAAGMPRGFMGMSAANIDSLFIDPACHGRGLGRALIGHARSISPRLSVDVNEQNRQALGFYQKMGFVTGGRSATDDQGRPYPLLHMHLAP